MNIINIIIYHHYRYRSRRHDHRYQYYQPTNITPVIIIAIVVIIAVFWYSKPQQMVPANDKVWGNLNKTTPCAVFEWVSELVDIYMHCK